MTGSGGTIHREQKADYFLEPDATDAPWKSYNYK